ncbi:uncharacterized protein LOC111710243 [Eurytemora carolleeae]|uniref:uncharacterized protein LOC111710243 n=1 Tax=Eurytemora carolleeae TaxID=1294199 RepID=UPI000C78F846|nr:uncharacterized protein LOC111710243 [Eurytemora carolleeae]|eukprot:XP_023340074.1 uncharacterized protein LOC111710243 [Eurytemora affinis]
MRVISDPRAIHPAISDPRAIHPVVSDPRFIHPGISDPRLIHPAISDPREVHPTISDPRAVHPLMIDQRSIYASMSNPSISLQRLPADYLKSKNDEISSSTRGVKRKAEENLPNQNSSAGRLPSELNPEQRLNAEKSINSPLLQNSRLKVRVDILKSPMSQLQKNISSDRCPSVPPLPKSPESKGRKRTGEGEGENTTEKIKDKSPEMRKEAKKGNEKEARKGNEKEAPKRKSVSKAKSKEKEKNKDAGKEREEDQEEPTAVPSPESANKSTIDCPVCKDVAIAHFHYGGMCCYSCKAFFRRVVNTSKANKYKCRNGSNLCDVSLGNRRSCQACRYRKCVSAGMKPGLVLSDEQCTRRFGPRSRNRVSNPGDEEEVDNPNTMEELQDSEVTSEDLSVLIDGEKSYEEQNRIGRALFIALFDTGSVGSDRVEDRELDRFMEIQETQAMVKSFQIERQLNHSRKFLPFNSGTFRIDKQ